jgi:hypothetical protein
MQRFGLAFFVVIGCTANKGDDDADGLCPPTPFHAEVTSEAATAALERSNVYRSIMNLEPGVLSPLLDKASQSHADYMACHGMITHQQEEGKEGFTGEWVWDRMEAAGYPLESGRSWSEVVADGYTATEAVDSWVGSVYHRIPFTMPYWVEVGVGMTDSFTAMSIVSPYPDGPRAAVMFPADGQTDVPIDFNSDWEFPDPDPERGIVGYPITVTVAAPTVGTTSGDPYDVRLLDASLVGPGGELVDIVAIDPGDDPDLYTMAAIWPVEPLEPGLQYEASMTVQWDGASEMLVSRFTTAD